MYIIDTIDIIAYTMCIMCIWLQMYIQICFTLSSSSAPCTSNLLLLSGNIGRSRVSNRPEWNSIKNLAKLSCSTERIMYPKDQRSLAWSCVNQRHWNCHAGLCPPPKCAQYASVPTIHIFSIIDIMDINNIIEMNAHLGTLPYTQFNTQTRAWIVRGNHGLHCCVPKAIRHQRSATRVSPFFCVGIPILLAAPHGITQELRGLFI